MLAKIHLELDEVSKGMVGSSVFLQMSNFNLQPVEKLFYFMDNNLE